jgi:glutamate-1-semialdehyde aminotransferase
MVFRKLFGRSAPAEPSAPRDEDIEPTDESPDDDVPQALEDEDLDPHWRTRAADAIPGGASTGSKRPEALYGVEVEEADLDDESRAGPTHYTRAAGCRVVTAGGETLIDCTMALGAVALGYADDSIVRAAANALVNGHVAGLSPTSEVELAERLADVIPCAEQVRFLKTGAEGVAAAVRIARTYTGRDRVVGSGYFGWLDWCSTGKGIPRGASADFSAVPFDDVAALERATREAGGDLAAIVLEPVVERLPSQEWIAVARRLADDAGAVLIFDEIKTGFRLRPGGYQEYAKVEPDLAVFGKAIANGFPLSAVVGRAAVMDAARSTWISSTLASEGASIAAALAVLEWHERAEVCDFLWSAGGEMMDALGRCIDASGIDGVRVEGIGPMWFLRFDDPARESRFLRLTRERGVLFKRGAYNYPSLAHDEETIADIEAAASGAFVEMMRDSRE